MQCPQCGNKDIRPVGHRWNTGMSFGIPSMYCTQCGYETEADRFDPTEDEETEAELSIDEQERK